MTVVKLEFKLFIVEIKKLPENEHLEQEQRINPFAPCIDAACVQPLSRSGRNDSKGIKFAGSLRTAFWPLKFDTI